MIHALSRSHSPYIPSREPMVRRPERAAQDPKAAEQSGEQPGVKAASPDEQKAVEKLKQRDREVRAHEAAHMAAGGGAVRGGASYSFERGPDGQQYAVGGEVSIDSSKGKTPEETIAKAQTVKAAALAPAAPSDQDRAVAAAAAAMEAEARRELAEKKSVEQSPRAPRPQDLAAYREGQDLLAPRPEHPRFDLAG